MRRGEKQSRDNSEQKYFFEDFCRILTIEGRFTGQISLGRKLSMDKLEKLSSSIGEIGDFSSFGRIFLLVPP